MQSFGQVLTVSITNGSTTALFSCKRLAALVRLIRAVFTWEACGAFSGATATCRCLSGFSLVKVRKSKICASAAGCEMDHLP